MQQRLLIIGCGDIGLRIVHRIRQQFKAYQCYTLSHTQQRFEQLREAGVMPIKGDLDNYLSLKDLIRLMPLFNKIIHLAPPPKQGTHDTRTQNLIRAIEYGRSRYLSYGRKYISYISPASRLKYAWQGQIKHQIMNQTKNQRVSFSYVSHIPHVFQAQKLSFTQTQKSGCLAKLKLIYISTTGVYGNRYGDWLDETSIVKAQTPRALRRLSAEKQLRNWAKKSFRNICMSILRVPGIYSLQSLPLDRLSSGVAVITPKEDSYTNRIHADDLAAVILCALVKGRPQRIINACDGKPSLIGDMFDALADWAKLPRLPRISKKEYEQNIAPLNQMSWSFMQESRRVSNNRLLSEYCYRFQYCDFYDFLSKQKLNH